MRSSATSMNRATVKTLDDRVREIVFAREGNRCRKCRRTDRRLQLCHVYPKGAHPWLRWDLDNVFCGCAHCHMNWWHAKSEEAMAWWESQIGTERMAALRLRAGKPRKRADHRLTLLYLEQEAKSIAGAPA